MVAARIASVKPATEASMSFRRRGLVLLAWLFGLGLAVGLSSALAVISQAASRWKARTVFTFS
jgi:hypothetical protein